MNPKRSIKKIQIAEKAMDVFEPWEKTNIEFSAVPPFPKPSPEESILYYIYIQYNILFALEWNLLLRQISAK